MSIKRIIVSRTDKIGDLVLSIPSFYMIKKMYPEAELVILVRKYNYEIVKNLPYVDRILKVDEYKPEILLEKIAYFKADVFIALYNDSFIAKLAKASKARLRIGPYSKLSSFFAYNKGVWQKRSKSIKNEAEYNLDLVRKLNPTLFDEKFEINTKIYLSENHKLAALTFLKEFKVNHRFLAVNPFMGGSAKNIKDEQYASLIKKFLERNPNRAAVIICHISEEERGNRLVEMVGSERVFLYANGGDLLNIAAVIEYCDVYLGPSTGPTHIAGALQKNIVGIYPAKKTQSTTRWGVFGDEKVKYVVPDRDNKKENYKDPYFEKYDKTMETELLWYIEKGFKEEVGE